jgi:hypothetical protein
MEQVGKLWLEKIGQVTGPQAISMPKVNSARAFSLLEA